MRSFLLTKKNGHEKPISGKTTQRILHCTFKEVGKNLWSARLSGGFRALALKKGDDYYWFWIGDHDEYDRLLN